MGGRTIKVFNIYYLILTCGWGGGCAAHLCFHADEVPHAGHKVREKRDDYRRHFPVRIDADPWIATVTQG